MEKIKETVKFLEDKGCLKPEIGIVLGTRLGGMIKEINVELTIDYDQIPNFPVSIV